MDVDEEIGHVVATLIRDDSAVPLVCVLLPELVGSA